MKQACEVELPGTHFDDGSRVPLRCTRATRYRATVFAFVARVEQRVTREGMARN
ncbi:MAG: hypothetical protein ABW101_17560 [Candidatus Thiodiazotropha sp.]